MLKPGLLTNILTGAFIVAAAAGLLLAAWHSWSLHQLENSHRALLAVNHNKTVARTLIADALEYRKRNPAIDPVLQAGQVIGPRVGTNVQISPAQSR